MFSTALPVDRIDSTLKCITIWWSQTAGCINDCYRCDRLSSFQLKRFLVESFLFCVIESHIDWKKVPHVKLLLLWFAALKLTKPHIFLWWTDYGAARMRQCTKAWSKMLNEIVSVMGVQSRYWFSKLVVVPKKFARCVITDCWYTKQNSWK